MNQQTLEYIYLKYQTQKYFQNYHNQKIRPDNRKFHQFRSIKLIINQNKVIMKQGSNIIIGEYNHQLIKVPYVGSQYCKSKIRVKLAGNPSMSQSKRQRYIQKYLEDRIFDRKQLTETNNSDYIINNKNGLCYAQVGSFNIKIVNQDGSLLEGILFALSILLTVIWIPQYQILDNGEIFPIPSTYKYKQYNKLLFPIKISEVGKQVVLDPTQEQQKYSNYQITFIFNLLQPSEPEIIKQCTLKQQTILNPQIILSLKSLGKQHTKKISIDIKQIRNKLNSNNQIDITIEDKS